RPKRRPPARSYARRSERRLKEKARLPHGSFLPWIDGEHDENEVRKDFTPSERVAIAETIRQALGERQGKRTDLQHTDNGPEVGETRDIAAKKAGFGSGKQYERAKSVTTQRGVGVEGGGGQMRNGC